MGKKVSAILFRINKFNNYKNNWVFNYKLNYMLNYYYKIYLFCNNIFLSMKNFYYNYIYHLYGKIISTKIKYKFFTKFLTIYNKFKLINLNLYIKLYKINTSCLSLQTLKAFIKFNLLKYTSIQNLYNKLYTVLLTEYLQYDTNILGLKIIISGRLNNTKLATSETFQIGFLPLQQLDIFVFYEKFCILTKYGLLGIKVWIGKNLDK